jgi:hypothetical protein
MDELDRRGLTDNTIMTYVEFTCGEATEHFLARAFGLVMAGAS